MSVSGRYGPSRLPQLSQNPSNHPGGGVGPPDPNSPPTFASVWRELRELFRRTGQLERRTSSSSPLTTKGDVYGYDSANARIPIGTDGALLTADSTQTLGLKWGAANTLTAGCLVLLNTYTASASASIDITSQITSAYDDYVIEMIAIVPATNASDLRVLFSTDNGSTWLAANYQYGQSGLNNAGTAITRSGVAQAQIVIAGSCPSAATFGQNGTFFLKNPLSAALAHQFHFSGQFESTTAPYHEHGYGGNTGTTAVNAVRFIFSAGNITSGTVRIYGVAKSSNQMLMNPGVALTTAGTSTVAVPTGVTGALVEMVASGAAGGGSNAGLSNAGGGGGSGERAVFRIAVTSGGTLSYTVGAGGTGVVNANGNNGNTTSVTNAVATYSVAGGLGGNKAGAGGAGGGRNGGAGGAQAAPGVAGTSGTTEGLFVTGGNGAGGPGTAAGANNGGAGAASDQYSGGAAGIAAAGKPGGGGGGASAWGAGGAGGAGNAGGAPTTPTTPTAHGAGGGGCGSGTANGTGGNGADGAIFITWL